MRLAVLHSRLTAGMALAAAGALAAGAGLSAWLALVMTLLIVRIVYEPPAELAIRIERATRLLATALFAWVLLVGLVLGGDVLPPSIALLFLLLVGEAARPAGDGKDFRTYALAFAVIIAATAYYPGIGFGLAFATYVVMTTLALMVGHLKDQAARFGTRDVGVERSFLALTGALAMVALLASVIVFVAFPRMPRSWFGQGRQPGGTMAGFSEEIALGAFGTRIAANPDVVLRIEFEGAPPADVEHRYWRGVSFDTFDGMRWFRGTRPRPATPFYPPFPYAATWATGDGRGADSRYRVFGGPPGARVLFGQHPVLGVRPQSEIMPWFSADGDLHFSGSDAPVYTVRSGSPAPPESRLASSPGGFPRAAERYLQLPALSPRVHALADSLTEGHAGRVEKVRALERYLSREFEYTLELPASRRDASIEHFLFDRRAGHCEYFASAMTLLLRSVGIPARPVNGFLGGDWNDRAGYLAVTGNSAHSWVEVWFDGLGWVPFDPTPAAERNELLSAASGSQIRPILLWLDSVQFRWYRWVMAYDLSTQRELLAGFRGRFSREGGERGPGPGIPWRMLSAVSIGGLAIHLLWRRTRTDGGRPRDRWTRGYLTIRRAYSRAGIVDATRGGPLEFAAHLESRRAPAAAEATAVVDSYIRARFAGEAMTTEAAAAAKVNVRTVTRELRRQRRRERRSALLRRRR